MVLKRTRSLTHTRHSRREILVKFALVDTQPVRVLCFLFLISSLSFSFLINAYYLFATYSTDSRGTERRRGKRKSDDDSEGDESPKPKVKLNIDVLLLLI